MLIYLWIFYISAVLSLNIPLRSPSPDDSENSNDEVDDESDNEDPFWDNYVELRRNSDDAFNMPRPPEPPQPNGDDSSNPPSPDNSAESSDDSYPSSLYSPSTSRSSGSYGLVTQPYPSLEELSISTPERPIERLEELLDISDLSSLESENSQSDSEAAESSGGAAGSSGEAAKSSGEAAGSSGEAVKSSGEAAKSSDEAAESSGEAAKSSGEASKSSGEAAQSSSEAVTKRMTDTTQNFSALHFVVEYNNVPITNMNINKSLENIFWGKHPIFEVDSDKIFHVGKKRNKNTPKKIVLRPFHVDEFAKIKDPQNKHDNIKSEKNNNFDHYNTNSFFKKKKLAPSDMIKESEVLIDLKTKYHIREERNIITRTNAIKHLKKDTNKIQRKLLRIPEKFDTFMNSSDKHQTALVSELIKNGDKSSEPEKNRVKKNHNENFEKIGNHHPNDVDLPYEYFTNQEQSGGPDFLMNSECPSSEEILKRLDQNNFNLDRPVWHSYIFDTGAHNREELHILEVVTEKSFSLDRQVEEWVGAGVHAVGRGPHGLTLVTSQPDRIHIENLELNEQITAMCMFQWWNKEEHTMNTGLLTAQDTIIHWYHMSDDNQLVQIWSWALQNPIKHMALFKFEEHWKIAVTEELGYDYDNVVSIYGLNLWKNWWFEQRLTGHGKPTIINDGKFLAIIQHDKETVAVYKYDSIARLYSCLKNITSPGVLQVSAFSTGAHSFLAVGGDRSAIYQIRGDLFEERTVLDYQLDHVELWLPIKLGFYRNDVLLLFQHRLDHYTHSSSVLEALQWDGNRFSLLEHSPCRSHNEEMFGFTCILDAEGERGLRGATKFQTVHGAISILTASEEFAPIMFEIKTELVKIPDPVDREVKNILAAKQLLQDRFLSQQRVIDKAARILNRDFHKDLDLLTADNWKIKELHAPSIHVRGSLKEFLEKSGSVIIAGQHVKYFDFNVDMLHLFDEIKNNHLQIKALAHRLTSAITKKEGLPNKLKDIKVMGGITVKGNIKINKAKIETLNSLNVNHVLKDSIKKPKNKKIIIHGKKIVQNLQLNNLNVENVNGINLAEPFKTGKPLFIDEDLEILSHLNVLTDIKLGDHGTFNEINLKSDIYKAETGDIKDFRILPLSFDSIKIQNQLVVENNINGYDFTVKGLTKTIEEKASHAPAQNMQNINELNLISLSVAKNLYFDSINGRPWKDFFNKVIIKSQDMIVENLRVDGSIVVDRILKMNSLNSLQFPQDYFLLNETSSASISGAKTFTTPIRVKALDCDGTVSGITPQNIVTLSTSQNLNNFTFYDITVTERLQVDGEITGRELDAFLSNPLLTETAIIKSNVIFRNLVVNGNLMVQNKINGTNWSNIFEDIVIKSNAPLTINSLKTFEGNVFVQNGLSIQSGFINNKRIKEFLTIDTDQDVQFDELSGDIIFGNIQIGGLFDGVNISDLVDNTVKLTGEQTIMADIIFDNDFDNPDNVIIEDRAVSIEAKSLDVTDVCNDWLVPDAVYIEKDNVILNAPEFERLYVDHLYLDGNLETSFTISGVSLYNFDKDRLSKTQHRVITAPYNIQQVKIKNLDFKYFNGQSKEEVSNFVRQIDNIHNEIVAGNVNIKNLHVSGKLDVSRINDIDLRKLADDAVWLREDNHIFGPITFVDAISARDLHLNGNACDKHFENFIHDIVRTTDESVEFTGKKTYFNGLVIKGNIVSDFINNIPISNILDIKNEQTIKGMTYINGDINIYGNLQINGMVNDVSMGKIAEFIKYADNNEYYFQGDVSLADGTAIDNFIINGFVNEIYDPNYILSSLVDINNNNYFEKTVTFHESVFTGTNLDIEKIYNAIDVGELIGNIVFLNSSDFINSSVEFKEPLTIYGKLNMNHNLEGNTIQGCSLEDWKNNAVYLDRWQRISGSKHFHDLTIRSNINVDYLNKFATKDLITVNVDNFVNKLVKFDTVYVDSDITIKHNVNSVDLEEESLNCLMKNGNQVVESPTHFHSNVFITDNANINMVNGRNFNNLITVHTDHTLLGNYIFHGTTNFENNLNINGAVTDIDLEMWMKNAVHTNNYSGSPIQGKLDIFGNVYFKKDIRGSGLLNGVQVQQIADYLRDRNMKGIVNDKESTAQYAQLCSYLNYLAEASNKQVYLFKNIQQIQSIPISNEFKAYHFTHDSSNFMIIGKHDVCDSELWKWQVDGGIFAKQHQINTGCVRSWQTIKRGIFTHLVSLSGKTCSCNFTGMELWNFDGSTLQHITSYAPVEQIQESPNTEESLFGLDENFVYNYGVENMDGRIQLVQKNTWSKEGMALNFYPYKANSLLLTNGRNIFRIHKPDETQTPMSNTISPIKFKEERLSYTSEVIDFTVGIRNKKLVAAAWSDILSDNSTEGAITIYEDLFQAKVFQKIAAFRPTSLKIIQLHNYQTLLIFIENFKVIKIYSYHGYEGFKYLYSLNVHARKLQVFNPSMSHTLGNVSCLIISNHAASVYCVTMSGERKLIDHLPCYL